MVVLRGQGGGPGRAMDAVEAAIPLPISIARAVCDLLPQHVMLVGAGAERLADEAGLARGVTLTEEARQMWQDGLASSGLAAAGARHGPGEVSYRRKVLERRRA